VKARTTRVDPVLTALARRSARLPAAGQVRVEIGGTDIALHLHDLGFGGFAITAPRPFWKGMTHRFTFETHDGASITLVAKVVHCTPSPDGVTFITGWEFMRAAAERHESAIGHLVNALTKTTAASRKS
jgi:hypothetical protein